MQQVAGELQTARNKAIVKNANQGVVFAIMDADTYRFMQPDDPSTPANDPVLGPIQRAGRPDLLRAG